MTIIDIGYLQGINIRGAGWAELWPQPLILGCIGLVIITVETIRFQKRLG